MKVVFMPGVSGDPAFWRPVAERLPSTWDKVLLGWPGLGNQPASPEVNGWDDLYRTVERCIDGKVALVAQSMGGMLAMRAALAHPRSISHLVLTATSGGIDLSPFGVQEWRDDYRRDFPAAPQWVFEREQRSDAELRTVEIPTLLIWGNRDPISPASVGRHLAKLLVNAKLVELDDDSHMFARDRPDEVAPLIAAHLQT
jgi:pimeloyl-ACP methyl ester carboxylesterase